MSFLIGLVALVAFMAVGAAMIIRAERRRQAFRWSPSDPALPTGEGPE